MAIEIAIGSRARHALLKAAWARQEDIAARLLRVAPLPQMDDAEMDLAWLEEFIRRSRMMAGGITWIRLVIAAQLNGRFAAAWALRREGIPVVAGLAPRQPVAAFTAYEDLESAAAYWKRAVPLSDEEYEALVKDLDAFAREAARQTGVAIERVLETARAVLNEAWAGQWALAQFRKEFRERVGSVAKHTLESIFRTTMARRYGDLRADAIRRAGPNMVPFLQYLSIPDDRRTPICKAMHHYIAASHDPIWDLWTPPNHWNCRSDISPIVWPEAVRMGIAARTESGTIEFVLGERPYGDPPATTIDDATGNEVEVIPQVGFREGEKASARRAA